MKKVFGFLLYINSVMFCLGSFFFGIHSLMSGNYLGLLSILGINVAIFAGWGGLRMNSGEPFLMWKERQ